MCLVNPELAASMGVLVDMPGKSWSCERCAEVKKIALRNDLRQGIEAFWADGWHVTMYTVTSSLKMGLQAWRDSWSKLTDSLKLWFHRQGIREIELVWVKEYGKMNGMRHVHGFLAYKPVPGKRVKVKTIKDRLMQLWSKATCGESYITKIKSLLRRNGMKSVYYAVKYISKQESQARFARKERRYNFTRGWPRMPKNPGNQEWEAWIYPRGAEMVRLEMGKIPPGVRKSWMEKGKRKAKVLERLERYGDKCRDAWCHHLDYYE